MDPEALSNSATGIARRLNHERRGSVHITLALIEAWTLEADGEKSIGARVLTELDVPLPLLSARIRNLAKMGPDGTVFTGSTDRAQWILDYAEAEAKKLKHSASSEHVLLGLLSAKGSKSKNVIEYLGITLEKAREVVLRLHGGS